MEAVASGEGTAIDQYSSWGMVLFTFASCMLAVCNLLWLLNIHSGCFILVSCECAGRARRTRESTLRIAQCK